MASVKKNAATTRKVEKVILVDEAVPETYTLELSRDELKTLYAVTQFVDGPLSTSPRRHVAAFNRAVEACGAASFNLYTDPETGNFSTPARLFTTYPIINFKDGSIDG